MTDRIPPRAPAGCVWMPCAPDDRDEQVYVLNAAKGLESLGKWHPGQGYRFGRYRHAARLMRRLGPDEDPVAIEGAMLHGHQGQWTQNPKSGLINNSLVEAPAGWYAPVRFASKVPDFGETGHRLLDEGEPRPEGAIRYAVLGRGSSDDRCAVPITIPPLPKRSRLVAAHERASAEAFDRDRKLVDELLADGVDAPELRAENERLQARLREAEEARHEADAKAVRALAELRAEVQAHDKTRAERDLWRTRAEVARAQADSEIEGLRKERDEVVAAYDRAHQKIEMLTADRDEARAELGRVREVATENVRSIARAALRCEPETQADALRRIADGEV